MPTLLGNAASVSCLCPDAFSVRFLALPLLLPLGVSVRRVLLEPLYQPRFVLLTSLVVALSAGCDAAGVGAVTMSPEATPAQDEPGVALPPPTLDEDKIQATATADTPWMLARAWPMLESRRAQCPPHARAQVEVLSRVRW